MAHKILVFGYSYLNDWIDFYNLKVLLSFDKKIYMHIENLVARDGSYEYYMASDSICHVCK